MILILSILQPFILTDKMIQVKRMSKQANLLNDSTDVLTKTSSSSSLKLSLHDTRVENDGPGLGLPLPASLWRQLSDLDRRLWRPDDFLKTLLTKREDPLLLLPDPELPLDVGVGASEDKHNREIVSGRELTPL